jgi:two-component system alkaline phosphatase synthesis response regulator PhoP
MDPKGKRILVADDEPDILEIIGYNLRTEGYEVFTAKDGEDALVKAKSLKPDIILLDVMMPHRTGMEVCKALRSMPSFHDTLIVFLTALNDEISHVRGLEFGADDYISKPISPRVLVTKINSLFRRHSKTDESQIIHQGDITIDPAQFLVIYKETNISLAKKEFELLYLLASRPGRVFLRNEILTQIWGSEVIVGDRTIDVHIRKIRQKLGIDCITTVKGVGYKFDI